MNRKGNRKHTKAAARGHGFTLIELLVVVAIIGLLVGILLPSLSRARTQARRVTCASQLHQVGLAMMAYMHDSRDRMPFVSFMPSIGPTSLTDRTIYLADVLMPRLKSQRDALQCPDDKPGATERGVPNAGRSYYETERASYGFRTRLVGLTPIEFSSQNPHIGEWHRHPQRDPNHPRPKVAPATIWFACDYDNFHGRAGQVGARRYVYIDGHVSDYEN